MTDTSESATLLPTYSHEQRLEDESLDELRPLLRGFFVIRDQRQRDFGVDLSIEITLGDRATNYNGLVQVKARSSLPLNQDGSLSLRMESSNIEYLLSGASSTIVLYDADRKTFYWADVLAEVLALSAAGVNYREQTTVTLRLSAKLTRETVESFQNHLLAQLRAARQLRFQIAGLDPDGLVHVDVDGVGTTNSDVEREFLADGWRFAAHGHVDEVARLFGLLSPASKQGPRVRLLMSYAHACNGQVVARE